MYVYSIYSSNVDLNNTVVSNYPILILLILFIRLINSILFIDESIPLNYLFGINYLILKTIMNLLIVIEKICRELINKIQKLQMRTCEEFLYCSYKHVQLGVPYFEVWNFWRLTLQNGYISSEKKNLPPPPQDWETSGASYSSVHSDKRMQYKCWKFDNKIFYAEKLRTIARITL